jgi:hypothetical protein
VTGTKPPLVGIDDFINGSKPRWHRPRLIAFALLRSSVWIDDEELINKDQRTLGRMRTV